MHSNLFSTQMTPKWLGRILFLAALWMAAAPISQAGVYLTSYNFPYNSLPQIYTNEYLPEPYRLRAKFAGNYHAVNGWNNNWQTLEGVPGTGWTTVELYWVKYAPWDWSTILEIGPFHQYSVYISPPKSSQTVWSQNATTYGNQPFTPTYSGGGGTGNWQFVVGGHTNWNPTMGSPAGTNIPGFGWSTSWTPTAPGTYSFWVAKCGDSNYYDSNMAGPYTLTVQAPIYDWGSTPSSVPSGTPYTVMLNVGNTGGYPWVTLFKNGAYFSSNPYGTQGTTSDIGVQTINYLGTYSDSWTNSSGSNGRQVQITPPLPSGQVTGPTSGVVGTNNEYSLANVSNANDWQWEADLPGGGAFEWQGGYGTSNPLYWAFGSGEGTYKFRVHLRGPGGNAYSNEVTVSVTAPAPPVITAHPASQTVNQGQAQVTFNVGASGAQLSYQWRKNGNNIPNANGTSLTLYNVQPSDAAGYSCYVSNAYGNATSNSATLTVNTAPVITSQPQNQTVPTGGTANFSVVATGNPAPGYQWRKDGVNLSNGGNVSGATSATLTLTNVQSSDAATYTVYVSNIAGNVTSSGATLTVTTGTLDDVNNQNQLNIHLPLSQ